jgi:hypothetical protein
MDKPATLDRSALALLAVLLGTASSVSAQRYDRPPERGGEVFQLGMPPIWKGNAGATFGWYSPRDSSQLNVLFHAGLTKDLLSPVAGVAAIGVEGYAGYRGNKSVDGGARALFSIPSLRFTTGVDYNIPDGDLSAILRLEFATRRSGIFGRGTMLRVEWLPGRGNSFALGVNAPLWGRNIGKTRPQRDAVEVEQPPAERIATPAGADLDAALSEIRESARWIARLATPLVERGGTPSEVYAADVDSLRARLVSTSERFPAGRGLSEEQQAYHDALDRLFTLAMDATPRQRITPEGRAAAQAAREVLLEEVLLPYDRLVGQRKAKEGLGLFAASAHSAFARQLIRQGLPPARTRPTYYAFQTLVDITEEVLALQEARFGDTRLVWLPLQLALPETAYDSQEELDQLIGRAARQPFSHGNLLYYVMNEDFQLELSRSVLEAKDYHVLWIHDYRGLNDQKKPDLLGFGQTVRSYLRALTERVSDYDRTGTVPQYFIFLDQNYFEANGTRLWFRLLEDPLANRISLPKGYEIMQQELDSALVALKQAVAGSRLLEAERLQFGDKWLRNRIRVHINITNPADNSFTSNHLAGIIPVPDNAIRDHRKIAFYDITEADPYQGRAMYTGMGVGEHYVGANWEDRAIIVRGPSALTVKDAARQLLEQQGFAPDQIPLVLRSQPLGPRYQERADSVAAVLSGLASGWTGEALELHNQTGYATKAIDLEKAILYSLMPAGSVIKVPDSLWQSWLYASLLTGSAMRGCRVLIVVPSLPSAPSAAAPTMARAHGLFSTLLVFQNGLSDAIEARGGLFRIGFYAPKVGVGDLAGRIRQGISIREPWMDRLMPRNPEASREALRVDTTLAELGIERQYLVAGDTTAHPKLHMKANFFASGAVWAKLMALPEWGPVTRAYIRYVGRSQGDPASRPPATELPQDLRESNLRLVNALERTLTPEDKAKAIAYFTIGSVNMDYRSMFLDGEVMITMTGWNSLPGLMDFLILTGLCEWPTTQEHLDRLLPPPSGLTRSIASLLRNLL